MKKILKIPNLFLFILLLFKIISCIEIAFQLEKISKSITYQNNDDYIDNDYYYIYKQKNDDYNDELKILYQTGNINNENQISSIPYDNNINLYINIFANDDCFSNEINTFLFCKENLFRLFYASFNIYKTINELYSNKIISKKIFGQEYSGNNKENLKLYLGDINSMNQGKISYKCKTNKDKKCLLTYISIINNSNNKDNKDKKNEDIINNIEINSYSEINIGYSGIKGSYNEGKKIFDYLLTLPSFKDKCNIITSKSLTIEDEYIKLFCNSDTNIYDLPQIIFSFGENNQIQLLLTSELLFYKQYDVYGEKFFYLTRIEFSRINKNWVIGKPLLNDVNLIYDLDENNIIFIFEEQNTFKINLKNKSNSNFKKVVIIIFETIGIIILIFVILFICFYCHRKRKTMEMKDYIGSNVQKLNDL